MRVLVTGGAGFIGSNYVRELLGGRFPGWEDTEVVVADHLSYAGALANLPLDHPRLTFVEADICDPEPLLDLLRGCHAVVHFAAESHVDRSLRGARQFVLSNVLGTQTLLECCQRTGVPRIVHVSTDEVYGSLEKGNWDEDEPLLPNSPYAASKAAADLFARVYFRSHGVPVVITRCSNNYGPYQHREKVIPLFITNLLSGRDVPLYGDGLHRREWLHVSDHCRGVHLALEKGRPGEIYNLGGGTELTNRDLTGRLLDLCGAGWDRVRPVADRQAHDRRYALDFDKARRDLGYEPRVDFDEGLADVVRWYRENRQWWDRTATPSPSTSRARLHVSRAGRRIVIGASGFIGSRLLGRLNGEGREAAAFTRGTPPVSGAGPHPMVRDAEIVYYLASSVNPAIAQDRPDLVAADHDAFERLLDVLADMRKPPLVVLTSSGGAVYDPSRPLPYSERTPTIPRSAYGKAKLALETALLARGPAVPGLVLRLSNVYGPGQRTGTGQGVLAHWLESIAARRPLRIYGDMDSTVRDYVYIDDVVDALASVCRDGTPEPVMNIGSGEGATLGELLSVTCSVVGEQPSLEARPARDFDRRDVTLDIRLATAELNWRPRTSLPQGIALTWREMLAGQALAGASTSAAPIAVADSQPTFAAD